MANFETKFRAFLASLIAYNSNEEAVAALGVGRPYWSGPGHKNAPEGRLMKTL